MGPLKLPERTTAYRRISLDGMLLHIYLQSSGFMVGNRKPVLCIPRKFPYLQHCPEAGL